MIERDTIRTTPPSSKAVPWSPPARSHRPPAKGKHQKGVTLGVLAPEGGHFDFKPQKGVTLLISHTGGHCIYLPEGPRIY